MKFSRLIKCFFLIALSLTLALSVCSCGGNEEFTDDDEFDEMPDFNYVIYPLLDEAQLVYANLFSEPKYSNKSVEYNGRDYFYVESALYEGENYESLLYGIFTKNYAEEYIKMMFDGENPLYIEREDGLYVEPTQLSEYVPLEFGERKCSVADYRGDFASIMVKDSEGETHRYTIIEEDGIWRLDGYVEK